MPTDHPYGPRDWCGIGVLGLVLVVLGVLAILLPTQAAIATSAGLGALFAIAGLVTILHALRERGLEIGFNWRMLAGAAEIVGGILIWLSPMKGAAAIALMVVVIITVQGAAHLMLALKSPGLSGRLGLGLSGLASLVIAIGLVARFPYSSVSEPGAMAGVALLLAGVAHLVLSAARYGVIPKAAS